VITERRIGSRKARITMEFGDRSMIQACSQIGHMTITEALRYLADMIDWDNKVATSLSKPVPPPCERTRRPAKKTGKRLLDFSED
jgi:hypothetical protein